MTLFEPRLPKHQWGQRVRAAVDLYNDGSFPGTEEGSLLVSTGAAGEIVQVGAHAGIRTRQSISLNLARSLSLVALKKKSCRSGRRIVSATKSV